MFDAFPVTAPKSISVPAGVADRMAYGPITNFDAGAEIYAEGERVGSLYQVAYGVVRVYRLLADGRRQICAFHAASDIFGFETGSERHFFADAVCITGLRTLRSGSEAELSRELLKLALQSLDRAHDHLLTIGRNDAMGRVAAFLLEMADRQDHGGRSVSLPMSRLDIADYLSLTIETVSRVITRLKESGVIRLASTRQIDIVRPDALRAMTA